MTNPYDSFGRRPLYGLFAPVLWPRSYANLLYLFLGFPIGLLWFVVYVTGLSLGLGLLIIGIGVAILFAMVLLGWPLVLFERVLAHRILGVELHPARRQPPRPDAWLKDTLSNSVLWTGLVFLAVRFPLGLISWILAVLGISVSLGFMAAPLVVAFGGTVEFGIWNPDTPLEALPVTALGIVFYVATIHLLNGTAWLWGRFARLMLGRAPASPRATEAPVTEPALFLPTSGLAPAPI